MLTFSKLINAFVNPPNQTEKIFSQYKLAQVVTSNGISVSVSTINGWATKDAKPRYKSSEIYDVLNRCREEFYGFSNDSSFVEKIINNLDVELVESNLLREMYADYNDKFPDNPDECNKEFITKLIEMSLNNEALSPKISFNPENPTLPLIGIGIEHIVGVKSDGTVLASGASDFDQCNTHAWRDIVAVAAGHRCTIGLKKKGNCIAVGNNVLGNGEIFEWNHIISVCCGAFHILGLKGDGTVVSYGVGGAGQCNVSKWNNITAISAGINHSVGLLKDGTVVSCGSNEEKQCEVSSWKNVKQIAAGGNHTVGLTNDGQILYTGDSICQSFSQWNNIKAIATGLYHVVGLRKDGTVLNTGHKSGGRSSVYKWFDIKYIYAGYFTTAGIKTDGSVIVTNDKHNRSFLDTSSWNLFCLKSKAESSQTQNPIIKEVLSLLEDSYKEAMLLAPYLFENRLEKSNPILSLVCDISKDIYHLSEQAHDIPYLSDLILRYLSVFLGFLNIIPSSTDEYKMDPGLAKQVFEAGEEYLNETKSIIRDIREQ